MKALYYSFCFAQLFLLGQVFQVSGSASSAVNLYGVSSRQTFVSYSGNSSLDCSIQHLVNLPGSFSSVGQKADVDSISMSSGASYPKLSLKMAVEVSNTVVEIFIMVSNKGSDIAYNALVRADLSQGLIVDYGTLQTYSNITSNGRLKFNWTIGMLAGSESKNLSFKAEASKDILQEGFNYFDTYCTYKGSGASEEYGPFAVQVGLKRVNTYKDNLMYKQGLTALSFFILLILGVLLVIMGFYIFSMIRRRRMISPQVVAVQLEMGLLRLKLSEDDDEDEAEKRGDTIHGYCSVAADESIVKILAMRDKTQMHREIESLDILSTIDVETNIERERNHVSELATFLLIKELRVKGKITKVQEDDVIRNYKNRKSQMDKTQDDEYQRELKRLYKKIAAKNRAMLSKLHQKQEAEKREAENSLQGVTIKEQAEVSEQLDQQHQKEKDEETYQFKLKQAKKTEELKKKFTIKKQTEVKKLHLELIKEIKEQGRLDKTDFKSLMKEYHKNQKKVEKLYDEEISRQRMVLEEKLARRKNLAHMSEVHEADEKGILKEMESQQVELLEHLKEQNAVSDTEADKLIQEAKQQMLAIKDRFDKEKLRQEEELHKRLSDLKKQRLTEDAIKHKSVLDDFDKKHQAIQKEKTDDPIMYAKNRLKLLSDQLQSKNELENDLEEKHAKDMISLHKKIEEKMENELQQAWTNLQKKLSLDGSTLDSVNSLLNQHDEDLKKLKAKQDKNRQHQEDQFKEKLAKNRESWNQRKEAEKDEQQQLRDCEERISGRLNDSQVELSDEDREMILRKHEEHKVKLENNLALNKLRQMQMMDEKLAQKRAQRLEELQQEQEMRRQHAVDNNAEESNEDSMKDKVELMKEQIQQKLSVFQEEILDWDDEMEKIQAEMVAERSLTLLKQEEQLETMIAELQIKKRKEIAKIERQQHKIGRHNASLVEELNGKGTLNKPECQAFLEQYRQQQEQFYRQLEEKKKQEDEKLQKKIKERSENRERTMLETPNPAPIRGAARWKQLFHVHKHNKDMENFRKEKERKRQELENFESERKRTFEEQELVLLIDFVKNGQISKEELNAILVILHPDKTDAGISDILNKIYDRSTMEKDGNTSQQTNTKKRKKKKKSKKLRLAPESHDGTAEAHYVDDEGTVEAEMAQQPLPVRLPPLRNETKK